MLALRKYLRPVDELLTEPSWFDLWILFILAYGAMMRVRYEEAGGLGGAFARWSLSILLALYGATIVMSMLVLAGRGARALFARLQRTAK